MKIDNIKKQFYSKVTPRCWVNCMAVGSVVNIFCPIKIEIKSNSQFTLDLKQFIYLFIYKKIIITIIIIIIIIIEYYYYYYY